jgi:predicted MFS family arabinose efflux permease
MSADATAAGRRAVARVFLPFACGYFVSYFFRTVNAVLSPDLVRDLRLDAGALGLLTGAYFLAFALFQLPLGVLLDRWGPRRVNAGLLALAACGAALFALAESLPLLVAARALIGLGVSACLMASIKAFTLWFPLVRLASLNGWLMAVGGLGAMASSAPLEALLGVVHWRGVFAGLAALTLAAAGVVFLAVPERAQARSRESVRALLGGFRSIYGDPGFWRIACVSMAVSGSSLAVQGLWVAPWLRDVAGLTRAEVAGTLFAMAAATTAGFAAQGPLAGALARRGVAPLALLAGGGLVSALLLGGFALGVRSGAPLLWCLFAAVTPLASLGYAIQTGRYAPELAGRVNTAVNLLVFVAAFAAQWGVGALVDRWPLEAGRHPAAAFGAGFGVLVAAELLALAWLFLSSERRGPVS